MNSLFTIYSRNRKPESLSVKTHVAETKLHRPLTNAQKMSGIDIKLSLKKTKKNKEVTVQLDFFPAVLRGTYIKKTSAFEFIQAWIEEAKRGKAFQEALVINE